MIAMRPGSSDHGRSNKANPRTDDYEKSNVITTRHYPLESRSREERLSETSLEERATATSADAARRMGPKGVEGREELARFIAPAPFPADAESLITVASENNATERVLDWLRHLPQGEDFQNVEAVWLAIGGEPEPRF